MPPRQVAGRRVYLLGVADADPMRPRPASHSSGDERDAAQVMQYVNKRKISDLYTDNGISLIRCRKTTHQKLHSGKLANDLATNYSWKRIHTKKTFRPGS